MTPSLYRRALGAQFPALPAALRELHELAQSTRFIGEAEVIAASNPIARLIAKLTGFPIRSYSCRVEVRIDIDADGEIWHRDFGGHCFHSRMECRNGRLAEHIGPHRIQFDLQVEHRRLTLHPSAWHTFGIPLPHCLWPKINACETEVDGCFHFDVATAFPMIGRVIHYRGWLRPASP